MSDPIRIDGRFIDSVEGFETVAYVPAPERSNSGVTIANGLDLGQQSAKDLARLGLSEELIDRFSPYLGLKKQQAQSFLAQNPLEITPEEGKEIKHAVIKKAALDADKYLKKQYGEGLASHPQEIQTALTSLAINLGSAQAAPKTFQYAGTRDYQGLVNELRNFGGQELLESRRHKEADFIEPVISKNMGQSRESKKNMVKSALGSGLGAIRSREEPMEEADPQESRPLFRRRPV